MALPSTRKEKFNPSTEFHTDLKYSSLLIKCDQILRHSRGAQTEMECVQALRASAMLHGSEIPTRKGYAAFFPPFLCLCVLFVFFFWSAVKKKRKEKI